MAGIQKIPKRIIITKIMNLSRLVRCLGLKRYHNDLSVGDTVRELRRFHLSWFKCHVAMSRVARPMNVSIHGITPVGMVQNTLGLVKIYFCRRCLKQGMPDAPGKKKKKDYVRSHQSRYPSTLSSRGSCNVGSYSIVRETRTEVSFSKLLDANKDCKGFNSGLPLIIY